jgi:hypothetical protein
VRIRVPFPLARAAGPCFSDPRGHASVTVPLSRDAFPTESNNYRKQPSTIWTIVIHA